ncbi:uncharacterized protein LOC144791572 [Lissotriton helveticus]
MKKTSRCEQLRIRDWTMKEVVRRTELTCDKGLSTTSFHDLLQSANGSRSPVHPSERPHRGGKTAAVKALKENPDSLELKRLPELTVIDHRTLSWNIPKSGF